MLWRADEKVCAALERRTSIAERHVVHGVVARGEQNAFEPDLTGRIVKAKTAKAHERIRVADEPRL